MKLRRVLSLLVALVMTVEVLPLSSIADELEDEQSAFLQSESVGETAVSDNEGASLTATSSTVSYSGIDGVTYTFNTSTGSITAASVSTETDVIIPSEIDGVEVVAISGSVFYGNKKVLSVVIPSTVTSIGDNLFWNCTKMTSVVFQTSDEFVSDDEGNQTTVHRGTTSIGDSLFYGCTSLASVTLPDTLESIPTNTFYGCSSLQTLEIPSSVTSIGQLAFSGCSSLTSITVPGSVETLNGSFYGCTGLESVVLEEGVTVMMNECFRGCSNLTSISIPSTLTDWGLNTFYSCSSLTSIYIPEGVTSLYKTFYNCSSLNEVSLPSTITTIGESTFYGCSGLEKIEIPGGVDIGYLAFGSCTGLKTVIIDDGEGTIGEQAFSLCSSLETVEIGDGTTSIGKSAFTNCKSIESVTIPDSVTSVGELAFYGCTAMESLTIGEGITAIPNGAFQDCSDLTSVTIPLSVAQIDTYAFSNDSLTSVYIMNPNVVIDDTAFDGEADGFTIYGYSESTAETYADSKNYNFVSLENMSRTLSVSVSDTAGQAVTDGYTVTWYDASGEIVSENSSTLANADSSATYTAVITLDSSLLPLYAAPEAVVFEPESEASATVILQPAELIAVVGSVTDSDGNMLGDASISAVGSTSGIEYSAITSADGTYSLEVLHESVTIKIQKDGYYSHKEYVDLTGVTASEYNLGTCSLVKTVSDSIVMSIVRYDAVTSAYESVGVEMTSASTLNISLTDSYGRAITGFEVQGLSIIFEPDTVEAGDTITIYVSDRSGNYEDAEPVTVQLDSNRLGSATISMVQKGGFTLSSLSGPEAVMTVVDSNGNTVLSKTASVSGSTTGLGSGNYTAILIEKSSLMRSAPSESYLDSLGLVAGVDYLKVEFTVSSGVITELGDLVVPDFDESKLSYTTSSSVTLSKASGMTVGSSFTLRVAYELDTSKATGASTISVVFPDGVSPISQIAAIDSDFVTFTYSDGVATVDVSGKESSAVTFFCVAGTTTGTYNINASLNLSDGAIQPLGTARAVVETASISAPDRTSTETITVSGCTLPNSVVTVYDNGTLVAETTSNSVGSWSTTLTLAGKLYSYSYHYIYAETVSEVYGETVLSDEVLVVYSEVSVEVQKVTMYTSTKTLEFDLTSDSAVVPYYSYMDDDADYTFTVQVSPESVALIEDLYVYTVDAYGDETYVELQYDATTGLWAGNHEYSDPNTIPVAIGAAYNCSDEYYMIPEDDEELLQDLSESSAAVYDAVTDYWNEIIDNNIEEVYDEDTGIVSVYYVDTDTEEETLMFTYVHYYSELTDEFTAEYLEESGFCATDDDENCWVYAEEYGEDYLESYVTCVVDMDAAEIHVISYDYSNLYEEETPVVYSTRSSVSEDTTYLLKANGEFNLLTSATSSLLSAPNTTTQYKIPETITDNITTWDRTKDTFTTMDGIAFGTASDGLAAVAKDAADQMDLPRQFASSGLARTFQILSGLTAVASQASTIDEFNKIQSNLATRISILYDEADKAYSLALAKCDDGTTYKLTKEQIEATANAVSAIRDQISLIQYAKWENLLGATAINLLGCVPGIGTALSFASAGLHVIATGSFQNAYVQQIEKEYVRSCNEFNEIHKSINTLINGIKSNYQDCDDDDEPEPEPEEQTPYLPVRAIQDPSGYVYEAVPSNTLEGVTAVISYNDNGTTTEWDAEAYSQANPQVTDESGTFQWDVPTGEWIVSFTKDGYYSTDTSDSANANDDGWLPVPPPQVNIAVAMVSTASPTVESVTAYTDRIEIVFSQYMDMSDSDTASVLNSISVTRDGTVVDVIVTALDAEYDLEGTTQYATRFAVVPSDGVITDGVVVTVNGSAENYAGTPIGADYVSSALTVQARPTEISSDDSVEAVIHETTSIEVALMPAISGTTLTVESSSEDIVSVTTASVTTDVNGIATLQIEGQLPGAGVITITEPISGVSTTIDISVVWVASNVAVEPVVATLEDGTVLTSGMTIPASSVVTLSTTTSGATIRYTVNDTCPKKDAALYYSEPIVIDEDTVLRAAAYLDGTYSSTIRLGLTVDDGSCSHVSGEAVQENIVNATCTTAGSYDSVVYCTVCGEELSRETITVPATEHTEAVAVVENEVAATCTTDGSYDSVIYCTVCNEELLRETVTVPATGHTEAVAVVENEVAATCTADGSYDSVVYCTVCGEELSRETITVPATEHTEAVAVVENEVAATCTTDGSYDTVIYCTVCNEELSRETVTVPATGHTEAEAVVENEVAATCTTDGSYDSVVYCTVCGEELSRETIVVPAAHTAGTAVRENVVEATRTTEGSYDLVTYCTVCGEEISRETVTVPATGVDMITVWLRTPADYSAVNNAIAKASALNPDDYTNFSDVTDAINAVNWSYNALMQSYVNEMAEKIETAITNLIPVGTTTEEVEIQEPIEDTNTDTEDNDEEKPSETSEPKTNPTTGIAISILPMMIAALAAVSAKRR